jgi:hypothetical protein
MAKESGIGLSITIDESDGNPRDISNDIRSATWTTPQGVADVTGLDKSAIERLGLLKDAQLELVLSFNDASNLSFEVFKDYYTPVTSSFGRSVVIAISGQTLTMEMIIESVSYARSQDGDLQITATLRLCNGTVPTWA